MTMTSRILRILAATLSLASLFAAVLPASAQSSKNDSPKPWMNTALSADQRADLVLKEMTLDEKISLLHGTGMMGLSPMSP